MIEGLPFQAIDWTKVPSTEHSGETGRAEWRTIQAGPSRVRMVEYSPGYFADHWCKQGHVLLVPGPVTDFFGMALFEYAKSLPEPGRDH